MQVARLGESPTVYVLDGAHTGDSAAALAATLRQAFPELPVVLLVAMAADKQHRWVLGTGDLCGFRGEAGQMAWWLYGWNAGCTAQGFTCCVNHWHLGFGMLLGYTTMSTYGSWNA